MNGREIVDCTIGVFKYADIASQDLPLLEAQPLHLMKRDVDPEDKTESGRINCLYQKF